MKIDITPTIEKANERDSICIRMREIPCLYEIRLASGKVLSTQFDDKSLSEFLPNKTVSEVLKSWEENFHIRYNRAKEALSSGLHPSFTVEEKVLVNGINFGGKTRTVPAPLNQYTTEHMKNEMIEMEKCFGGLQFIKIIL